MAASIKSAGDEPNKRGRGRPPKERNLGMVEQLAAMQSTDEEIAAAPEPGKARGRASLRRIQWKPAQRGNAAMAIFLGKNLLGQRDRADGPGEDVADTARRIVDTIRATEAVDGIPHGLGRRRPALGSRSAAATASRAACSLESAGWCSPCHQSFWLGRVSANTEMR